MEKKTRSRKFSSFKVFYSYLNRVYGENTSIIEFLYKNEGPKKESGRKEKNDYRSSSAFLLEKRDRAILEILYSSGIRVFELVNARLEDLSEDNKILRVFGKRRKVILFLWEKMPERCLMNILLSEKLNTLIENLYF